MTHHLSHSTCIASFDTRILSPPPISSFRRYLLAVVCFLDSLICSPIYLYHKYSDTHPAWTDIIRLTSPSIPPFLYPSAILETTLQGLAFGRRAPLEPGSTTRYLIRRRMVPRFFFLFCVLCVLRLCHLASSFCALCVVLSLHFHCHCIFFSTAGFFFLLVVLVYLTHSFPPSYRLYSKDPRGRTRRPFSLPAFLMNSIHISPSLSPQSPHPHLYDF